MLTGRNIKLVLSLLIPLAAFMVGGSAMAIEKAKYQVLEKDGRFEMRHTNEPCLDGAVIFARCSDCNWYSASGDIDVSRASRDYHHNKTGHDAYLELYMGELKETKK